MNPKVSICIPCHNQEHFLNEALNSCLMQNYDNIEIIVLDDASSVPISDKRYFKKPSIKEINPPLIIGNIKYFRSETPSGTGGAFNKAMSYATGDIIVLLCSDDWFTDKNVIQDIVNLFNEDNSIVHVSRWYYQFIDGKDYPVRAWRGKDIIELANNPSGLAFRAWALRFKCSNKMFVEASTLVFDTLKRGSYKILEYDTVAVRIHQSISQNKDYYLKRWTSSPVEEWSKVGGQKLITDFTSLIQIKNNFKLSAVFKECWNFIKLRPINIINPAFWFFALVSILTPRFILRHLPHIYRITWGKWTTRVAVRDYGNQRI